MAEGKVQAQRETRTRPNQNTYLLKSNIDDFNYIPPAF